MKRKNGERSKVPLRYNPFEGTRENPRSNGSHVLTGAHLFTSSHA